MNGENDSSSDIIPHISESVGVLSVHFVMPWFLTLFTSLPCWDTVLAVWDLFILHGLPAVFQTALTIIELLEPRLMELNDEGAMLPLLLRVPVDVAQYTVLIPALWNTEVQDWELKCMNGLVLDDTHNGPRADHCEKQDATPALKENVLASSGEKTPVKDSGAKSVLSRVLHLAQRYLLDPMGRQRDDKLPAAQTKSQQCSPVSGRVFRSRTSASIAQIRWRRRSQQRAGTLQPAVEANSDVPTSISVDGKRECRSNENFKRSASGPISKTSRRHSNHSLNQPLGVRSRLLLRSNKDTLKQNPQPSSALPPTLRSSTLPPASSPSASNPPHGWERSKQDTPRTAFLNELSSRHQTSVLFSSVRESALI